MSQPSDSARSSESALLKRTKKRDRLDPRKVRIRGQEMWQVDLGTEIRGGKPYRHRRTFADKRQAQEFSRLKQIERANRGPLSIQMPDALRLQAIEAERLLKPYDASLLDVVREFVKRQEQIAKSETVSNAFTSFLDAKSHDGLRPRYLRDLRFRLARFVEAFGDRSLASIESAEISLWLRSLGQSALSRNTYAKHLSVFFAFARQQGWVSANPLTDVPMAKAVSTVPGILTVEEAARLLENAHEATLPFHALGMFAGLRSAEIQRLRWENIDFESRLIEVSARSSKTASRRLVTMQSSLTEWLLPYRDRRGPVCPPDLHRLLAADRKKAGVPEWPSNALRHSFASYHLARFKNAAETALEMGHTNAAITFRHYRELVRPSEAERFWKVAPVIKCEIPVAVA